MEQSGNGTAGQSRTIAHSTPISTGRGGAPRRNGGGSISPDLALRLRELGRRVSPAEISEIWVFPPLEGQDHWAEFVLFTRIFTPEKRRLCAVEFRPRGNGNGGATGGTDGERESALDGKITEYGAVPSNRIPHLVAGFLRRLGEEREPLHLEVEGSPESWDRLVTLHESAD
jgi:hypothetical protein